MDILNFISWIKSKNYREKLPTDVINLLAVGAKDPSRDDSYLSLAVNAAPLQSLYDTGAVTQDPLFNITQSVTLNTHSGVIVTVGASATPGTSEVFTFFNTNLKSNSILLLSVGYPSFGTGTPVVSSEIAFIGGSADIIIKNPDSSGPLDQSLNIYFTIINPL